MNKILTKISSASAALLAAGIAVTPVCAAGNTYTPVSGTTTNFTKTITMSESANVPNVTFSYAVAAGTAQTASDGNLAIFAGNDGVTSSGLPTIADITFTADTAKATSTTVQKNGVVDFSNVSFKEPGVYRYVVTESGTAQGLSTTEDQTKALDVYVVDTDGALSVAGYVMHNDETAAAEKLDETKKLDDKDTDFEHTLATSDLTLSKSVTGNQASHDEYFKFTVKLTGAVADTKFSVDLSNADATTLVNGINTEAHENPAELVADATGEVTQDFWLQHGQSIKIKGIAGETAYDVVEANGSYTTSIAVTGDTEGVTNETPEVSDTALTADTTVAYTNEKKGAVPTGLFMGVGASALAVIAAGTGIVTLKMKKKDEE